MDSLHISEATVADSGDTYFFWIYLNNLLVGLEM